MIAADELHTAVRDVVVSIFRTDEVVVLHFQSVFLPAARFSDNMKKWQVAFRAIRKMYFVHVEILPFKFINEQLLLRPYHLTLHETTSAIRRSTLPQFLFFSLR